MDNKKIIGIGLIALSLFIILIGLGMEKDIENVEKRENTVSKVYEKKKDELNLKENDFTNNSNKRKVVIETINDFIYYLNIKDFEKAFAILNKDYIENFGVTMDNFINRYSFDKEKIIIFDSFDFDREHIIVKIKLKDKDSNEFNTINFTLYSQVDGSYSMADIGIYNSSKYIIENKSNKMIETEFITEYETSEGYIYDIEINNTTDKILYLSLDDWAFFNIVDDTYKYNYTPLRYNSIDNMITPKEKKNYKVLFNQSTSITNLYITLENEDVIEVVNEEEMFH